jgi:hypothetical protein
MNPTPKAHSSLATFILYILIAIIFFVGGYFLGTGRSPMNQGASFYAGVQSAALKTGTITGTTGPTNPGCPDGTCGNPPLMLAKLADGKTAPSVRVWTCNLVTSFCLCFEYDSSNGNFSPLSGVPKSACMYSGTATDNSKKN